MLASCPEAAKVHDEGSGNTILHLLTNHQVASFKQGQELLSIPQVYALRNSKNHQRDTPLHLAARNHDTTMVRVLLVSSPKLGLKNKSGVSAGFLLRQLIKETRITKKPVEHKRIFTREECEATIQGNFAFLNEQLLSSGMNFLVAQTPKGDNILHILMQCGPCNLEWICETEKFVGQAIQILSSLISQQDSNGETPVHLVVKRENHSSRLLDIICECFKKVGQEAGGDVIAGLYLPPWGIKNVKGDTSLHVAVRARNYKCAIQLLKLDEKVAGYINNRKQTPLHLLSTRLNSDDVAELIRCLISGNSDIAYMQDEDGLTPLLTAVLNRSTLVIEKLNEQFPECVQIVDLKGRTLWHLFVSRRLEQKYLSRDEFDLMGKTPERLISRHDNDYIRSLMAHKDSDGNTPLHLAIENRHFGFALFFLDNWVADDWDWSVAEKYDRLLSVENKEGVSSYNLIGSAEHLPREFEKPLSKNGNLLYGHRSLYGVPTTKIEEYANTIGVIAALLATITFTAAFTIPGGLDSSNGTPLLLKYVAFQVFITADVVAMCSSVMVLFCLLWIMTTGNKKESILLLDVSVFLLQTSFHATLVTFMTGLYVTTIQIVPAIAISTCVACTLLIILMHKRLVMLTVVPFFGMFIVSGPIVGRFAINQLSSIWSSFIEYNIRLPD